MTGEVVPQSTDFNDFILGVLVGSGNFSNVYRAITKETQKIIAVKLYKMKRKSFSQLFRAATEMAFLRFLNHENIITHVLSKIEIEYMYLGLEFSSYGCLSKILIPKKRNSESFVKNIMKQLMSALNYLHSMHVMHGDVKPDNIIVTNLKKPFTIKLSDFELAEVCMQTYLQPRQAGSFFYMAPELHLGFPSDYTCDLFSAGIVMFEICYGRKPFMTNKTKSGYKSLLRKRIQICYPKANFSDKCISLLKSLLSYDKQERPTGDTLIHHPFLEIPKVEVDSRDHYIKGCELLTKSVKLAQDSKYNEAYVQIIEAILRLKIYAVSITDDEKLYSYTLNKLTEYKFFSERIAERLISEECTGSIEIQTHSESVRCSLLSTPSLLTPYDICMMGDMYVRQGSVAYGAQKLKDGLSLLISALVDEPRGIRKEQIHLQVQKWLQLLEEILQPVPSSSASKRNAASTSRMF